MSVRVLDPGTALVLIDLQRGITALPTVHDADAVVRAAGRLVAAWHERTLPVVAVHVEYSADLGDVLSARTDATAPRPGARPGPDFAELHPELGLSSADLSVTKRGWNAFYGTELDLQLRRRRITGIVLGGISTSIGVESTARAAAERGYEVAVAVDAVTDTSALAHQASIEVILPRLGCLDVTDQIIAAVRA